MLLASLPGLFLGLITLFSLLDSAIRDPAVRGSIHLPRFVFVTADFDGPSKHSSSDYEMWIPHLLQIFVGELYFYTTSRWRDIFTNRTRVGSNIRFRLNYSDPFEIPCMRSLRSAYEKQWSLDRERKLHKGPHVYGIWNGKLCLVAEVSLLEPNAVVFWIDAGSCREKIYWNTVFPNADRLRSVITPEVRGAMIFTTPRPFTVAPLAYLKINRIDLAIGGFFGGDQAALREYWTFFWAIHDYFLERGAFVGKEQNLMSTYLSYTDRAWIQPNRLFLQEWIKSVQVPFHPFGG
jgi:hypothetical protein